MDNLDFIKFKNIVKTYNSIKVLEIKDLSIRKNECIALIGDNGAGKTTLIQILVDLIKVDKGDIFINNYNIHYSEHWKNHVSIFLNSNLLVPYLNPKEYLYLVGKLKNISNEIVNKFIVNHREFYKDELFDFPKEIRYLSQGNQNKVGIMSSLLGDKELIIMDEPFANLDISSKKELAQMISKIRIKNKSTFLISSHNIEDILKIATRVLILKKGSIIMDTVPDKIDKVQIENLLKL